MVSYPYAVLMPRLTERDHAMREMKENQHVQPVIDLTAGTVTFKVKGHDDIVLHSDKLHADIIKRAALVGMAQVRIVDAAAIPMTRKDGSIIPAEERIAMKHANMAELVAHYETGTAEWSRVSEGGGGGKSLTVEAIARVKEWTYEQAQEYVEKFAKDKYSGDTKKCLAFLRTGKRVMDAMEAIKAERMKAPVVDADNALDELNKAQ